MEDTDGKIWFGTSGGAQIHSNGALRGLSAKNGLCGDSVNAIQEAGDGNIWFATHQDGVCRFDGESFTHFTAKDGVEGTEAGDLYKDLWHGGWQSLFRDDGKSIVAVGENGPWQSQRAPDLLVPRLSFAVEGLWSRARSESKAR